MECLRVDLDSRLCDVVTARIRLGYRCMQQVADAGLNNPEDAKYRLYKTLLCHTLDNYAMESNIINQYQPAQIILNLACFSLYFT